MRHGEARHGEAPEGGATGAIVIASSPAFDRLVEEHVVHVGTVAAYRPGAFFERELPAIRALLALTGPVDLLILDGYVDLDPAGRPGLGAHAHSEFGMPVIGVAKTPFRGASHAVPVLRGGSQRPLFVTAAGLPVQEAATLIRAMRGPYRLPDALRRVDALARGRAA